MTRAELKKLLAQLRQMPSATPAEALAEFRRRVVELGLKAKAATR